MKIKSIDNSRLRNDEHFQFQSELVKLVNAAGAGNLNITPLFNAYLSVYEQEDEALKKVMKSAVTDEMEAADRERDSTFSGLSGSVKMLLKHFDPAVTAAAKRLSVLFNTYGNVARKTLNEETSAIYNLLQELNGNYAQDVQTAGIGGWVEKLDADNKAFDNLVTQRNDENAAKTQLKMKECRAETDKAYAEIVKRINALIVVEGEAAYSDFVNKLNGFIEKYNNTVAQRQRKKA